MAFTGYEGVLQPEVEVPMVTFRPIDLETDRELILEVRVQTLFQDETPWARSSGMPSYRRWYLSSRHPDQFFKLLTRSLRDRRTIADVVEVDGTPAGFVWATFVDVPESKFTYVELRAMGLRTEFQRQGLGRLTAAHIDEWAIERGADAARSFAGTQNEASIAFHRSLGFEPIEIRYEKLYKPRAEEDV
jgi:GNAT superfamily N-acetyltransferase